jgi:magnesium chelatase family protein
VDLQMTGQNVAPAVVTEYQKRISDPLIDRRDIQIEVPRVDCEKLSSQWVL